MHQVVYCCALQHQHASLAFSADVHRRCGRGYLSFWPQLSCCSRWRRLCCQKNQMAFACIAEIVQTNMKHEFCICHSSFVLARCTCHSSCCVTVTQRSLVWHKKRYLILQLPAACLWEHVPASAAATPVLSYENWAKLDTSSC